MKTSLTVTVYIYGRTENSMKESGKKASFMERGSKLFQMGPYLRETGKREGLSGKGYASTQMEPDILGVGLMDSRRVWG